MKLLSLRLRGAKGIRDGLGIDEVNIDFTKFEPGTIVIYGDNGAGKTTLIENLTPYRKLFTRSGGLASHFDLKDSCRDLYIDIGPDQYRFLININADSGKIESYVYRNGVVVNADGKEGSYNEEVYKLFGSPEMFSASLLMPQKRTPFSKLPPERREELFNLGPIQAKSKYASDQAKALDVQVSEISGRIKQLDETIAGLLDVESSIEIGKGIVKAREESLAKIEARIAELNLELATLDEKAKEQAGIKAELASLDKSIQQLQVDRTSVGYEHKKKLEVIGTDIGICKADIAGQERLLDSDKLAQMRHLVGRREALTELLAAHVDAYGRNVQAKTELASSKHNAEIAISKADSVYWKAADETTEARNVSKLIDDVPCQQLASEQERQLCSQCQFLQAAIAAKAACPELTTKEIDLRDELARVRAVNESAVASAEAFLADSPFDEQLAKSNKAEAAAIDAQKPAEYIQRAEVAETKLAGLREKRANLERQYKTIQDDETEKVAAIMAKIEEGQFLRNATLARLDASIDNQIADIKAKIVQVQTAEKLDRDQLTTARKDIEVLQEKLEQRFTAEFKLSHEKINLSTLESDQADWTHLSQMLSRNGGFQSYLIETSAVEMTEFANELLKGYDVPWSIEIATSTDTADGKGKKDGFFVFVNTPTGQRELGDLSGGQAVWVDTILQHAVAFVQQRLSGKKLLTKIMDEADGSLDEERAIAYLNALQAAHAQSGLWHTILISHRPEIQNMVGQRIHFLRGKGVEIERD